MDLYKSINQKYSRQFREHGDSAKSVMIPKDNQEVRFNSIAARIPKNRNLSYLDYGCGLGHQMKYFNKLDYKSLTYSGVEINPDFLEFCRTNYTGVDFFDYHEFWADPKPYDMIGAVGTFNLRYTENDNFGLIKNEITRLWGVTREILFLNFMSNQVDFIQDGAYHQDLGMLYEFSCNKLSRIIEIDSSYLPYEYTFIIKRG